MDYFEKDIIFIIADLLSFITIASCLVIKVPQIRRIDQLKSAKGISLTALLLELLSYSVMTLYNYTSGYSYLSYMEYPILLIQEYALIYLVMKYKNFLDIKAYAGAGIYVLLMLLFTMKLLPTWILLVLVPFMTPIGATSKVIQLIEILKTKDSTSVSLTTWALSAFTNFTRIYTVLVESGDIMLLFNFSISFLLSSSVFGAASFYKIPKADEKKTKKIEKKTD